MRESSKADVSIMKLVSEAYCCFFSMMQVNHTTDVTNYHQIFC
jgi:hypothetical protein